MSSGVYNHRTLQPSASASASASQQQQQQNQNGSRLGASGAEPMSAGTGALLLNESFESIRKEFEGLVGDVRIARAQRDEYELKVVAQVNELNLVRQSLYDLEAYHSKVRDRYEEELERSRSELASLASSAGNAAGGSLSLLGSKGSTRVDPYYRERERTSTFDRDRERDREKDRDREREKDRDRERDREREKDRDRDRDRERDRDPKRMKYTSPRLPPLPSPHPAKLSPTGPPGPRSARTPIAASPPMIPHGPPGQMLALASPATAKQPQSLSDIDIATLPPELKKEGQDWFCIFNPALFGPGRERERKKPEVNLVYNFTHATVVCCVQFSTDGKYLATGCNRTAQIFDMANGHKVCALADDTVSQVGDLYIRSVRFSPDGKYLATGAEDKLVRIWDISRRRIIATFPGHTQEIYSLDFSADGRYIVSGSGDRTTRIWDLGGFLKSQSQSSSADTSTVASSDFCRVLTAETMLAPGEVALDSPGITSVSLSPNSMYVAAGSLDSVIRIWDTRTGELVDTLRGHGNSVYSVVWTKEGTTVLSGALDCAVRGWDVSKLYNEGVRGSKCTMEYIGHKDYVLSVAVSRDTDAQSQYIVSGSKDRGVVFWEREREGTRPNSTTGGTGKGVPVCLLQGHKNSVISINVNPTTGLLATGSGDCMARVWSF